MIIKKLKSIIARWAHDDENKRLREKLRMYKGYLRAANKGAECSNRVSQISAARNSELWRRMVDRRVEEDRLRAALRSIAALDTSQLASPEQCVAVVIAMDALSQRSKLSND
jgi:hypothetical protein